MSGFVPGFPMLVIKGICVNNMEMSLLFFLLFVECTFGDIFVGVGDKSTIVDPQSAAVIPVRTHAECAAKCVMRNDCTAILVSENSSECALLDNVASSSSSAKQNTGSITGTLMMSSKYRLNGFEQQTQTGQFLTSVKDIIVTSAGDCALECGRIEECISFSVTPTESLQKKGLLCRIPDPYDTFWKENNETTLYFERPLPYPSDVHLATDGNFYKVTPASSNELLTPTEHRDKCNFFFGVIAPVYPRKMAAAVEAMFLKAYPASISSWWTSLAGLGYHEGKLLIPATGDTITPSLADPDQSWYGNQLPTIIQPDDCYVMILTAAGKFAWNSVSTCEDTTSSGICLIYTNSHGQIDFDTEVENPGLSIVLPTLSECARMCEQQNMGRCRGYSTEEMAKGQILCKLPTPGEFYWTAKPSANLFYYQPKSQEIPPEFTQAEDGRYYKIVTSVSGMSQRDALLACQASQGTSLALPYPKKRAEKIAKLMQAVGVTSAWTIGKGTAAGTLMVEYSGELKLVPDASDPKQAWSTSSAIPNPVTASHCIALNTDTNTGAPFWNAVDCSSTLIKSYVCEASPPYFQIPSTKRWFRISLYPKVNPTGQMSAEWFCQRDGGTLAPTYGPTGLPTLTNALSLVLGTTSMSVHACGTRLSNGSWSMCGENVQPSLKGSQPDSQFWFTGEPGGTGSTNFLAVRYSADKATYLWDDVAMNQLGFICGLP